MPDAIVIVDGEGTMVYVNSQAERLFGYERHELLGQPVEMLVPRSSRNAHQAHRVHYSGDPRPRPMGAGRELQGLRKDGSVFAIEISLSPYQAAAGDGDGNGSLVISAIRDVTERKNAEEIRARLAAIVESSEDAIVGQSLDGIVTSWNRAAERIFGYTAEEMVGKPFSQILGPDQREREAHIFRALLRGERVELFEVTRQRKDGTTIHVSVSISPIRSGTGEITGASRVTRDITGLKRIEEERSRLLQESTAQEEASRIKDEFLAILSHELRTPLNAILGWAHALRTGRMTPEKVPHAYEAIERNVRVQAQLIDELLDVSRIVGGKMELELGLVDLGEIVGTAADVVRGAAEAKTIRLETALPASTVFVQGDPARLQQIVWNLLSNAVKFTPAGGLVTLRMERVGEVVGLTVSDTGQGIEPAFLPHVFDRFRQADTTVNRKHGGLGLGLAIVRSLVALHGGEVEARSDGNGRGATFIVTLPVATPPPSRRLDGGDDVTPAKTILLGVRVLVVDDEEEGREILKTLLELHGATVRTAARATEALRLLEQWLPDLLISDIGMPERDGYALISEVRQLPEDRGGRTPALALTGHAGEGDRERALAAGFQLHASKPVDVPVLVRRVALLVASAIRG